jgi:hypothetical protein
MAKSKPRERDDDDDRRDRRDRGPEPVARDGAYVMMLVITLLAIAVGCFLMYKDSADYGSKTPPKETFQVQKLGDQPKTETPTTPTTTP